MKIRGISMFVCVILLMSATAVLGQVAKTPIAPLGSGGSPSSRADDGNIIYWEKLPSISAPAPFAPAPLGTGGSPSSRANDSDYRAVVGEDNGYVPAAGPREGAAAVAPYVHAPLGSGGSPSSRASDSDVRGWK